MKGRIFNERFAVINLEEANFVEEDLSAEILNEYPGSIPLALKLMEEHSAEMVISCGPLTGTFAPSNCAGTVVFKNSEGEVKFTHLLWHTGVELKFSGFDAIVIKGKSTEEVYLWIHDGIPEVLSAEGLKGKDVWQFVDYIRSEHADDNIQVISRGGEGSDTLMVNYWYSGDMVKAGAKLMDMKLRGIALRGMEAFECEEDFFKTCITLKNESGAKGFAGMEKVLSASGYSSDLSPLNKFVHRYCSCFNCPYPCQTFLMLDEDPSIKKETSVEEPGFLLTDPILSGLLLSKGEETLREIVDLLKKGLNPVRHYDDWKNMTLLKEWVRDSGENLPFSPLLPLRDNGSESLFDTAYFLSAGLCPIFCSVFNLDLKPLFESLEIEEEKFKESLRKSLSTMVETQKNESVKKIFQEIS